MPSIEARKDKYLHFSSLLYDHITESDKTKLQNFLEASWKGFTYLIKMDVSLMSHPTLILFPLSKDVMTRTGTVILNAKRKAKECRY